jgi:hypothetical protein
VQRVWGLTRDELATRRRRRGNIDYDEHIDYRDGLTSWPIRIRPSQDRQTQLLSEHLAR